MKFNYLSYSTIYGYRLKQVVKGDEPRREEFVPEMLEDNKDLDYCGHACFSQLFNHSNIHSSKPFDIELGIRIFHSTYMNKASRSNIYLLNEEDFIEFMDYTSKALKVPYSLTKKEHYYFIRFNLKGVLMMDLKFLTTWLRYTYEAPYNFCMYDTVKLFRAGYFKNLDLFNAFNLVSLGWSDWGMGHACNNSNRVVELIPLDDLSSIIRKSNNLNSIYSQRYDNKDFITTDPYEIYKKHIAFLQDESFKERWKNTYLPNIILNNDLQSENELVLVENFNLEVKSSCDRFLEKKPEKEKIKRPNGRKYCLEVKENPEVKKYNWKF